MGRKKYDWSEIQHYHNQGNDRDACMSRFGFGIAAWYKAIRQGRLDARRHKLAVDWTAVQHYYDEGHTYRECRAEFRFAAGSWTKAVSRGSLVTRPRRMPLERILAESRSRFSVKKRLLEAGVLENSCDECGIRDWRGLPLSIQLHHRNGVRDDHRLENLLMLCPNCHSQTSTFGIRNRKQKGPR